MGPCWIHNLTHSCISSTEWIRRPRMSFFRSPKTWKSRGERCGLYGGCWNVSQPNFWNLSLTRLAVWDGRYHAKEWFRPTAFHEILTLWRVAASSETNHTALLFFACLHFQCCMNTLYTTLTSRTIKKTTVWTCEFSQCMSPTLQMGVSIRNNSVASFCE